MIRRDLPVDRLGHARFERLPCGLVWIESVDRDRNSAGELGPEYSIWLLVDPTTDRMIASIDGPEPGSLCFHAATEQSVQRKFISEEGAKRWCLAQSLQILTEERSTRTAARKERRMQRITA